MHPVGVEVVTVVWRRPTKCLKHKDDDGSFVDVCYGRLALNFLRAVINGLDSFHINVFSQKKIYFCVLGH